MRVNSRIRTNEIVDLLRTFIAGRSSAITSEIIDHLVAKGYARYSYKTAIDKLLDAGEVEMRKVTINRKENNVYSATSRLGKTTIKAGRNAIGFSFEQPTPEGVLMLQALMTGIEVRACS